MGSLLVLALAIGIDHVQSILHQRDRIEMLPKSRGIAYEYWLRNETPWVPKSVRQFIGDDVLYRLVFVQLWGPDVKDESLKVLSQLPNVQIIYISGVAHRGFRMTPTSISNDGIQHLPKMLNLTEATLTEVDIDDRSLMHFYQMKRLKKLSLQGTRISEEGFEELKRRLPDCEVNVNGYGKRRTKR